MKIIIPQIKMSNIKPGRQINDNYIIICEILTGIVKGNLAFCVLQYLNLNFFWKCFVSLLYKNNPYQLYHSCYNVYNIQMPMIYFGMFILICTVMDVIWVTCFYLFSLFYFTPLITIF